MKEIITIHIGRAGVEIGNKYWELFIKEFNLDYSGHPQYREAQIGMEDNRIMFNPHGAGPKYVPRAMFVDFEPTSVDELRVGKLRQVFHPNYHYTGKEDSGGLYGRGRTLSPSHIEKVMDKIQRLSMYCSSLHGFLIFGSTGGGTSSAFTSLLIKKLQVDYPKKIVFSFMVNPSTLGKFNFYSTEPYNVGFAMKGILETEADSLGIFLDNQALFNYTRKHLEIGTPTLDNLNEVIAQSVSTLTSVFRFENYGVWRNMAEIQRKMVTYPSMNLMSLSYSSLARNKEVNPENIQQVVSNCFIPSYNLSGCDLFHGRYLGNDLTFRSETEIKSSVFARGFNKAKREMGMKYVSWVPGGATYGMSTLPFKCLDKGVWEHGSVASSVLCSSTSLQDVYIRAKSEFEILFSQRAFVHHFTQEGVELSEFEEVIEFFNNRIRDYQEIEKEEKKNEDYE